MALNRKSPNTLLRASSGARAASDTVFAQASVTTKSNTKSPGLSGQNRQRACIKEHLGFAHGDFRPANIFLSPKEDVRLGDFDCTVRIGEQLKAGGGSYGKLYEGYKLPNASPMTEQYSLASCIFTIQFGHEPWHEIDEPQKILKLIRNEFPDASGDEAFGEIIHRC